MTIFTVKLPDELASDLGLESQAIGVTKGAVVREALKLYLKSKKSTLADQIKQATQDMAAGKKSKKEWVDWQALRAKCQVDTGMTPEEEVRLSRTRNLGVL